MNINKKTIQSDNIYNKIFTIRNLQAMIDKDLATLYNVPVKRLNEQVKRNIERFPESFLFQLNKIEKNELVANCDRFKKLKYSSTNPYALKIWGKKWFAFSKIDIEISKILRKVKGN